MDDLHLADALAASVSAGIECSQLLRKQRNLFLDTITILAQAVELRDKYTGGHTNRVGAYSLLLAEQLGRPAQEVELERALGVERRVARPDLAQRLGRRLEVSVRGQHVHARLEGPTALAVPDPPAQSWHQAGWYWSISSRAYLALRMSCVSWSPLLAPSTAM
jgi:hypothetical protein